MLVMRGLDKGNNRICIGQKKRDTGTFLFNSVLKTGRVSTKLTESTLGRRKTENDKKKITPLKIGQRRER